VSVTLRFLFVGFKVTISKLVSDKQPILSELREPIHQVSFDTCVLYVEPELFHLITINSLEYLEFFIEWDMKKSSVLSIDLQPTLL